MATVKKIMTKDMSTDEEKLKHTGAEELELRFLDILNLIEMKYPNNYANLDGTKTGCMLAKLCLIYQRENLVYTNTDFSYKPLWNISDDELAKHLLTWVNEKISETENN